MLIFPITSPWRTTVVYLPESWNAIKCGKPWKPFGEEEFVQRLAEKFRHRWSKPLGQQVAAEENRAIA
jgi:hypothetical protein